MIALLASLPPVQVTPQSPERLAVVARFYKPGKAPSRFELYLDGEAGGKRRMLTMQKEPFRAVWVSSSELLVQTDLGWYVGNVKNWKPRLVKDTGDYNVVESRNRSWKPSQPEFFVDETPDYFVFEPKASKFKAQAQSTNQDVPIPESGEATIEDPNGQKLYVQPYEQFSFGTGENEFTSEFEFQRAWRHNNHLFVMTGTHSSGAGSVNSLLIFEKGQQPRVLFREANNFDFHESRGLYAYCTPRTTSPLDPKNPDSIRVWSSELYVGNWMSRTTPVRRLYHGAVHVSSVSIRP